MPQHFTADTAEDREDKIRSVGGFQHRQFFPLLFVSTCIPLSTNERQCTYKRNIAKRSRNHICRETATVL
jgi:hypothetical protein